MSQAEARSHPAGHLLRDASTQRQHAKCRTTDSPTPARRSMHSEGACRRCSFPDNPCREYRHRERSGPRASGLEHRRSFRRHESGEGVSFRFLGYRPRIGSRRVQDRRSVRLGARPGRTRSTAPVSFNGPMHKRAFRFREPATTRRLAALQFPGTIYSRVTWSCTTAGEHVGDLRRRR